MTVEINLSNSTQVSMTESDDLIHTAVTEIIAVPVGVRRRLGMVGKCYEKEARNITNFTKYLIAENKSARVRMSLAHFGELDHRISNLSVDVIIQNSDLASSVISELQRLGVEDRIYKKLEKHNAAYYRRVYLKIIVGLVMSTSGASNLKNLGKETILKWLEFHSAPPTHHFRRKDLWRQRYDVFGKCFREISKSLALYFNCSAIGRFAHIKRSPSRQGVLPPDSWQPIALMENPPAHLAIWREMYDAWRDAMPPKSRSPKYAMGRLLGWLKTFDASVSKRPEVFLQTSRSYSFLQYNLDIRKAADQVNVTTTLQNELVDILDFSTFISAQLRLDKSGKEIFPLVLRSDIQHCQNELKRAGSLRSSGEVSSLALPLSKYAILREILEEGETGWPGSQSCCQAMIEGEIRYCPVLPTMFLIPFEIPERFVQLRRFDSGEGDTDRFNGASLSWDKNDGLNSGYWAKQGILPFNRGYARKTSNPRITGFFINTNKTGRPWVIPWQNPRVHKLLWDVRVWQERWNPIQRPTTPKEYLDRKFEMDERYPEKYPDIFPLFRMPPEGAATGFLPPSPWQVSHFWLKLMLEVQNRWNSRVKLENREYFVQLDKAGHPIKCDYNPHGMRVAGLTLLLQAGLPLELVSKLMAGHATVLMTLRYSKIDPADYSKMFEEGWLRQQNMDMGDFLQDLDRMSLAEASRRTVTGSDSALHAAMTGDRTLWVETDLGMCPWEGVRCGDGGPCRRQDIRNGKDCSVYDEVEGGQGNCLLCRHFITDARFGCAMYLRSFSISRQLTLMSRRALKLQTEIGELERQLYEFDSQIPEHNHLKRQIKKANVALNDIILKQSPVSKTFIQIQTFLDQFSALEESSILDGSEGKMLAHPNNALDEWIEVSDLEQTAIIVNVGRVYKSFQEPEAEAKRKELVDEIATRSGYQPIYLNPRSEKEKELDYDRAVKHILASVSRADLIAQETSGLTLQEMGYDETTASSIFLPQFNQGQIARFKSRLLNSEAIAESR